jgi:hypothetical protein
MLAALPAESMTDLERTPHHFGEEMDLCRGVDPRTGRRHRHHFVAAVAAAQRRPLDRVIGGKICRRDECVA